MGCIMDEWGVVSDGFERKMEDEAAERGYHAKCAWGFP